MARLQRSVCAQKLKNDLYNEFCEKLATINDAYKNWPDILPEHRRRLDTLSGANVIQRATNNYKANLTEKKRRKKAYKPNKSLRDKKRRPFGRLKTLIAIS